MSTTEPVGADGDARERLAEAREEFERVRDRVEEMGLEDLRRVRSAHETVARVLDSYEEEATGYGDFETYVEFQEELERTVEALDDDLPEREAFEAADETLHKRRLSAEDFETARAELDPAREYARLYDRWEAARESYRAAYGDARERLSEIEAAIDDRYRVLALGRADLDAPVEELREPVETYNEAVAAAFDDVRHEAPARRLLDVLEAAEEYPLVEVRPPPSRLTDYLRSAPVGEEPLATVREYADYSADKLGHYVEDAGAFQRSINTSRSYLRELDARPLQVDWPPPPASTLRWACRERLAVVSRFAGEDAVAALRSVRALAADRERYGRLREAAHARDELTADERERLAAGEVEPELRALQRERDALADALDASPEP